MLGKHPILPEDAVFYGSLKITHEHELVAAIYTFLELEEFLDESQFEIFPD